MATSRQFCFFQFEECFGQKIEFEVFDHDTGNGDDFLGRVTVTMVRHFLYSI